jgi:hypothetical protein
VDCAWFLNIAQINSNNYLFQTIAKSLLSYVLNVIRGRKRRVGGGGKIEMERKGERERGINKNK